MTVIQQAREAARNKYAWPGGYPLFLLMADGECLCPDCAKQEWRLIAQATRHYCHDRQWECVGVDINYEDTDLFCAHCNKQIESAYGEST